uniref:Cathepsin La n=1 Tax=Hucho hucho TaxID=62062 RepID=A0A4W5QYZ4_9TELE
MQVKLILMALCAVVSSYKQPLSAEMNGIWEEWKTQHGKQYSKVDEGFRRMIWETNQGLIRQHNLEAEMGKHTFTLGMNKFGDMTNKEYNALLTVNAAEEEKNLDGIPLSKWNCSLSAAPETWDWRQYGYVTPVKDQGHCGSCYAFAAVGALEGQLFKQTGKLLPLSEQNLVDCSGDYHNNGCDGGLAMKCFRYVSDHGIMSERKYPYTAEVGPCEYQNETKDAWCEGFNRVPALDEKAFRDTLYEVGPIAVSVNATHPSFKFYKDGVLYQPDCSTRTNHAVLAVGYGSSHLDYWIVKNSWGTGWGRDGYILMARGYNQCGIAKRPVYPIM